MSDAGRRFETWFRNNQDCVRSDGRYEARAVRPEEFDRVYDCVDDAFGTQRSRAAYDWLYRRNPLGSARCIAVFDRDGDGDVASSHAYFPWPLRLGSERLDGVIGGDEATRPALRGSGVSRLRRSLDSEQPSRTEIAWPNRSNRQMQAHLGRSVPGAGPLPRLGLPLRVGPWLRRHGVPERVGSIGDAFVVGVEALLVSGAHADVERVSRFDARFDGLTSHCVGWRGYWSDRDAEFLNWRYLSHPTRRYAVLAVPSGDEPRAFCVVSLTPPRAFLAEFVVESGDTAAARALVRRAARTTREAGCEILEFFCSPGSPALPLLRRCGFVRLRSGVFLYLRAPRPVEEYRDPAGWRLAPGDSDVI